MIVWHWRVKYMMGCVRILVEYHWSAGAMGHFLNNPPLVPQVLLLVFLAGALDEQIHTPSCGSNIGSESSVAKNSLRVTSKFAPLRGAHGSSKLLDP